MQQAERNTRRRARSASLETRVCTRDERNHRLLLVIITSQRGSASAWDGTTGRTCRGQKPSESIRDRQRKRSGVWLSSGARLVVVVGCPVERKGCERAKTRGRVESGVKNEIVQRLPSGSSRRRLPREQDMTSQYPEKRECCYKAAAAAGNLETAKPSDIQCHRLNYPCLCWNTDQPETRVLTRHTSEISLHLNSSLHSPSINIVKCKFSQRNPIQTPSNTPSLSSDAQLRRDAAIWTPYLGTLTWPFQRANPNFHGSNLTASRNQGVMSKSGTAFSDDCAVADTIGCQVFKEDEF